MRTCAYCAEEIQDAALVCRFCGRATSDQPSNTGMRLESAMVSTTVSSGRPQPVGPILGIVGAAVIVVSGLFSYGTFKPVDFGLAGDEPLAFVGSIVFYWIMAAVAMISGSLLLGSRTRPEWSGVLLGASAAALTNPLGQLLFNAAFDSGIGVGTLMGLAGGAMSLAGGLIAFLHRSQ